MTAQHEPDDKNRSIVETMAGFGVPEDDIARVIGIDPKTLRKHYREQLDTAFVKANMRVAQSLFRMATSGNNVSAAIFWLKARANWSERHSVDMTVSQAVVKRDPKDIETKRNATKAVWEKSHGNGADGKVH